MYYTTEFNGIKKLFPESVLFTCALDTDKFSKAKMSGADVIVIDIEDSVPPQKKNIARKNAMSFFQDKHQCITAIRVNCIRSRYGLTDILHMAMLKYLPDIIFLSKIYDAEEVRIVKDILRESCFDNESLIYSIIEHPKAIMNINKIASVSDGIIFGAADYSAEIGCEMTWDSLLYARNLMVNSAALYGIPCINCTSFELRDMDTVQADCQRAKNLGFTGMAAISPAQVRVVNEVFFPNHKEVEAAKYVLKKYQVDGQFAIVEGKVIGPPFIKKSQNVMNRLRVESK